MGRRGGGAVGGGPPRLAVVLVAPEIPPNTGNVSRTCVVTGTELHLVRPLGFSLEERHLRRAGLDYWSGLALSVHDSWDDCLRALAGRPLWLFTGRGGRPHTAIPFRGGEVLVFGRESTGLPDAVLAPLRERWVRLPMLPGWRSLNLSNAVAVAVYEGLRQLGFPGMT
jgi:tRNA (cytidine/uridine-2'-O-)-methyltransferase